MFTYYEEQTENTCRSIVVPSRSKTRNEVIFIRPRGWAVQNEM